MPESGSPGKPPSNAALPDLSATVDERRASGRSARQRAQRGTLGYWAEDQRKRDTAMGQFARRYADQNERDHAQLVGAIAAGAIESLPG